MKILLHHIIEYNPLCMSETGEKFAFCLQDLHQNGFKVAPLKRQFKRAPETPVSMQRREE